MDPKKLYINPMCGLANRMRFMAGGIELAKKLGVDYRIIWPVNWEVGARYDQLFKVHPDVERKIIYPSGAEYLLKYSLPRKQNLFITKLTTRRFGKILFSDDPFWYKEDRDGEALETELKSVFRNNSSAFIQGGVECYPVNKDYYRELYTPLESTLEAVASVKKALGANSIGVHIRRSDNRESITNSRDEDFIEIIGRRLAKSSDVKIYLATDDEEVKTKFRNLFQGAIITEPTVASRGSLEGVQTALKEMLLLASTKCIYGSFYSSYSEAASMLGDTPLIVIKRRIW